MLVIFCVRKMYYIVDVGKGSILIVVVVWVEFFFGEDVFIGLFRVVKVMVRYRVG